MILGYSPIVSSARIIAEAWLEDALGATWCDVVMVRPRPGPSNIADGPSRMKFEEIDRVGSRRVPVDLSTGWHWAAASAAGLSNPFDGGSRGGRG